MKPTFGRREDDDMADLKPIMGCDNPNRMADVIFVHGLDGDGTTTWHPKKQPGKFWPKWIGEDLPDVGVWSLDYDAPSLNWKGHAMPIVDRATHCLAVLDSHKIGERPVVFIAHSLGGLLVKQMLRHACDFGDPKWSAVLEQTKGIVFLSTPHSGSDIASWVSYVGGLLPTSVAVRELQAHEPHLRELNVWYRNNVERLGLRTQVYYETLKTGPVLVVDATTADPGIPHVVPIPMDKNHATICKPESKGELPHTRVGAFIRECVQGPAVQRLPPPGPEEMPAPAPEEEADLSKPEAPEAGGPLIHRMLPPSIGSFFKGREGALEGLERRLSSGEAAVVTQRRAIHGLGGVGKTRLAVEYAWRALDKGTYNAVFLVRGDSAGNLDNYLASLAEPDLLNLSERGVQDQRVVVEAVLRALERRSDFLLIADNVDDEDAARGLCRDVLPRLRAGRVLITSRLSNWPDEVP
ncbi:MAG TPA: alpha/beta fold hydrolase, partial [Sumerlaeia bacterium]|nr:alpha/beta fold hydrolase [Sumerlaeia bacterium]